MIYVHVYVCGIFAYTQKMRAECDLDTCALHTYEYMFVYMKCSCLEGYCSTVQGLLDWFEVDLGFTELLFIQMDLCALEAIPPAVSSPRAVDQPLPRGSLSRTLSCTPTL